jgi:hypothetical protein
MLRKLMKGLYMTDELEDLLGNLLSSIAEYQEAQADYSRCAEDELTPDWSCRSQIERCDIAARAFKTDFVAAVKAAMREEQP